MYIKRKLEATILKYLNSPEIIAIVGPRQAGKTTLLRHIFERVKEKSVFLTFEDNKTLSLFTHEPDDFIARYIKPYDYVFIDEFHYAKKGGKILKYIIDTVPKKILISGSSSIELTVQAVKHLVGRIFVFPLFPLDFEELLSDRDPSLLSIYNEQKINFNNPLASSFSRPSEGILKELRKHYDEYVIYGGYPRVATSHNYDEKKVVLKNIYNTYFLREVKDILGLVDDYKLGQMLKALALQIGNLIEYSEICNISELSYQTVKGYLNFLQKTFICSLIKPYFTNKRTEIVKNPKTYFFDSGLRNYVVDDFRGVLDRPDGSALLENGVAMQLTKQEIPFRYWRSKQQAEVDFVLDLPNNKKVALEIKTTLRSSDKNSKSVRDFTNQNTAIPLLFCAYNFQADNGVFLGLI